MSVVTMGVEQLGGILLTFKILGLYRLVFTFIYHGGKPHSWPDLMCEWSFEPIVTLSLLLSAILFSSGLYRLWRESPKRKASRARSAVYFGSAWLALFVALVSPVHAWGRVLFSAHMTQHEILMLVAAPLLVLSEPLVPIMWALPLQCSRRIGNLAKIPIISRGWHWLTIPLVAWILHAVAL